MQFSADSQLQSYARNCRQRLTSLLACKRRESSRMESETCCPLPSLCGRIFPPGHRRKCRSVSQIESTVHTVEGFARWVGSARKPEAKPKLILQTILMFFQNPYLRTFDNVIPNGGSTKIDMEIGIAPCNTHETVFLYFWVPHFIHGIS